MRFLCLHGRGSNSRVFEAQLAAVQYQLGDGHTYHFVEGVIPEAGTNGLFSYFAQDDAGSWLKALDNLEHYLDIEGPFDGVIAASQGAALAATLLVRRGRQLEPYPAFKLAIFFSSEMPVDPDALCHGAVQQIDPAQNERLIGIPTAHFWGTAEEGESRAPALVRKLCRRESSWEMVYVGSGIPEKLERRVASSIAQTMRRAIYSATKNARDA